MNALLALLGALLKGGVDYLLGRARDATTVRVTRDLGAAEAANETQQTITEIADEQAHAAADRDVDPAALSRRLRDRARTIGATGGSDAGGLA